jgi:hypothetical protein
MNNTWVFKVLIGLDMLGSAIIWRDADVTISSLTGLELRKPNARVWAKTLGWVLNHLEANHCEKAIKNDILRAQIALQLLDNSSSH